MLLRRTLIITALITFSSHAFSQETDEQGLGDAIAEGAEAVVDSVKSLFEERPPVTDTSVPSFTRTEEREPCSDYEPLRRPHYGDLHVHTAWSFDASTQDTRNKPIDAYRFAMGEPMGIQPYDDKDQPTRTIQIDRPLDFTSVTDHAAFMGEVRICTTPGMEGHWGGAYAWCTVTFRSGRS